MPEGWLRALHAYLTAVEGKRDASEASALLAHVRTLLTGDDARCAADAFLATLDARTASIAVMVEREAQLNVAQSRVSRLQARLNQFRQSDRSAGDIASLAELVHRAEAGQSACRATPGAGAMRFTRPARRRERGRRANGNEAGAPPGTRPARERFTVDEERIHSRCYRRRRCSIESAAAPRIESDESPGVFNLPLGIDDLGDYRQFAIDLAVGDLVVCYSDSLIESRRDASPDAEFLGEAGLLDAVRNCATLDPSRPADVIPALLDHIGSLNPRNLVDDDATILLFRPNGNAPRPSVLNTALAPLRVIGGAVSSIARGDWRLPLPDFRLANIAGALIPAFNRLWHAPAQRLSAKKPTR